HQFTSATFARGGRRYWRYRITGYTHHDFRRCQGVQCCGKAEGKGHLHYSGALSCRIERQSTYANFRVCCTHDRATGIRSKNHFHNSSKYQINMDTIRYHFSNGINCIFELPTDTARKKLPRHVEPVEVNHGVSLMGITVFDFTESPVGPYQELVLSLYAVPRLGIMERHPHGAVYPIVLASTNKETRDHAIDLWHLPHFGEDIY